MNGFYFSEDLAQIVYLYGFLKIYIYWEILLELCGGVNFERNDLRIRVALVDMLRAYLKFNLLTDLLDKRRKILMLIYLEKSFSQALNAKEWVFTYSVFIW